MVMLGEPLPVEPFATTPGMLSLTVITSKSFKTILPAQVPEEVA